MLIDHDYEDLEVWYPVLRLREAGAEVDLVGPAVGVYRGKHGYPAKVELVYGTVDPDDYDALLVPGGWAPDQMRRDNRILDWVRRFDAEGKVLGTICHGPWVFISAGICRGRQMTSTPGIKDDLINAGAHWVDEPVVVDGRLVSSRRPPDLPAFCRELIRVLADG